MTLTYAFRACDRKKLGFVTLGDGLWAATTGRDITVSQGDQQLAVLTGESLRAGY